MIDEPRPRPISIGEVQALVAREFKVDSAELSAPTRRQHVACARHVAMYLSRELAGPPRRRPGGASASFPRIARAFCRDHSSVIHACAAVARRRCADAGFARLLDRLIGQLAAPSGAKSEGKEAV
jgi:chromosomal replication initiator protein